MAERKVIEWSTIAPNGTYVIISIPGGGTERYRQGQKTSDSRLAELYPTIFIPCRFQSESTEVKEEVKEAKVEEVKEVKEVKEVVEEEVEVKVEAKKATPKVTAKQKKAKKS